MKRTPRLLRSAARHAVVLAGLPVAVALAQNPAAPQLTPEQAASRAAAMARIRAASESRAGPAVASPDPLILKNGTRVTDAVTSVARYTLEASNGGAWREIAAGTTIGYAKIHRFQPMMVRRLTLLVDDAVATPHRVTLSV